MDMAAAQARHRSRRRSGCATSSRRTSFPTRSRPASSGTSPAFRNASTPPAPRSATTRLRAEQNEARAAGRWFGIGIACYAELTGIGSRISVAPGMPINTGTETATIRIDSTGAVTAAFGIAVARPGAGDDAGADRRRASRRALRGYSRSCKATAPPSPGGTGTYASRSTGAGRRRGDAGRAGGAREGAQRRLASARSVAPPISSRKTARVSVAGTDRSMTFREVARAVYSEMGRLPPEARGELAATKTYDPVFGTTTSATHIATVEIDPETYEVRVERFVVAEDCGRLVNPLIVDGQVHGGVAQGIGAALYEEVDLRRARARSRPRAWSTISCRRRAKSRRCRWCISKPSRRPRSAAFAAWAKAAPSARRRRSPTPSPMRSSPLGIEINELPVTPERLFRLIEAARARGKT